MLKLASQLDPLPETVSLANNKFKTLKQLAYINRYLPNLANLSLQNNDIEDIKTLSFVGSRSDHVPKLGEAIFLGNPFREIFSARNELERYQTYVLRPLISRRLDFDFNPPPPQVRFSRFSLV